jgi:hypothetical protein
MGEIGVGADRNSHSATALAPPNKTSNYHQLETLEVRFASIRKQRGARNLTAK